MTPELVAFTGADGNRLVADRYGSDGRTVLLLHGGGQTRHAWDATGERLARRGFVGWCLDQRGHGDSAWVESGRYAFADYARDVVAVCDQIAAGDKSGERPVVIGASLGGIASMLAEGELQAGTMQALVLVDITPRLDPQGVSRVIDFMAERMHDGFSTLEEAAEAVARYLPNRTRPPSIDGLRKNLREHPDGRLRWHWDPRFLAQRESGEVGPESREEALVRAAERLTIPVLLVRGARSELVAQEHVEDFMRLVPHAEFADVAGAGHMVAGDRNDIFASAVLDFLGRLEVA